MSARLVPIREAANTWEACTPAEWLPVLHHLAPNQQPRAVQSAALAGGLLTSRRNAIVAAPTNSGKSLLGTLVLLQALRAGKRGVLIEPLRALANQQAEHLEQQLPAITSFLGAEVSVRVSTGDYRLQDEEFSAPAPNGELIVCTPERLEAILRNPDNRAWVESIGAVVLDEAHLISNPRRGPTQEFLLTSLLLQPAPPRLLLLSATLGNRDAARAWLSPCDVFQVTERYPPLRKEVLQIEPDQSANDCVSEWLSQQLATPNTQSLVFVYQTRSTESLAAELTGKLGQLAGPEGARAYHGQMSSAQRESVRRAFMEGRSRIVVTTSALAMGVNLPATHVVVRDLTYPGAESPGIADLLQMMGRAGRGDQPGYAVVLKRPEDDWNVADLRAGLAREQLPEFRSAFSDDASTRDGPSPAIPVLASLLSRAGDDGQTREGLEQFLAHSLGGRQLVGEVRPGLQWLTRKTLAFEENQRYRLTVLGQRVVRAVLPLELAAGFAQLLRDLMSVDPRDQKLGQWQELDHLLVLHLLHEGSPSLRRFSKALADQVTGWCQGSPAKSPMLFRYWIDGEKGYSKAHEVLASLGLSASKGTGDKSEWARQQGYLATFHAIVLHERGQGRSVEQLTRQLKTTNLEGVEERWRDELIWLLSGLARLLEIRTFYFHLREDCQADFERLKRVKHLLARMRQQVYDLQEKLKYCSPLGPALRDIRRLMGGGVGVQTIRKLEDAGVADLMGLIDLGANGMQELGIRRDIAKKIAGYLARRLR
jgi:helicase